jgi:hypothetical protein
MPTIPTLRRLRQEDPEFKTSLGYIERPVSKKAISIIHVLLGLPPGGREA